MILRNVSTNPQSFTDGPQVKSVDPQQLVNVSQEVGLLLLSASPKVWTAEAALVPPPPPSAP